MAILQIGNKEIGIIQNKTNGKLYKTSPYSLGQLLQGQIVELKEKGSTQEMVEVIHITFSEFIHAKRIDNPIGGISSDLAYLLPEEENGILCFSSQGHLFKTYDLMEEYLDDGGVNGLGADQKLDFIENKYPGFVSYRSYFEDKFNLKNGTFTEKEIEEIESLEFVNYEILMTFLNESRMMGIGDKVYYYHANDFIIEFDKGNQDVVDLLVPIADLIGDQDVLLYGDGSPLISLIAEGSVEVLSNKIEIKSNSKGIVHNQVTGYGYQSIVTPYHEIDVCNPLEKGLSIILNEYLFDAQNGTNYYSYSLGNGTTLIVNWGDGTSNTYNDYNSEQVTHIYANEGIYFPITELQFIDNSGALLSIFDGTYANNVAGGQNPIEFGASITCSEADGSRTGQAASGDWMMSTKLWVKHNFLGTHVGSYTHAWKKANPPGTWKRKKAKIHTSVDGTFRNDNCDAVENKTGSKTHNNDKKIQKTKSKVFQKHKRVFRYDVKSGHSLQKGGTNLSMNLSLEDC